MSVQQAYIFGAACAVWAIAIVWMFVTARRWLKNPRAAATRTDPASPLLPGKSLTWHAVPGRRIELGTTGFAIALNTEANRAWYTLYSPEGLRMAELNELPVLKQCGERFAAEREEFTYIGVPPPQNKAQA